MATSALRAQNWFETTLSSSISASDVNIPLNAVPNNVEGYLVIEPDNTTSREVIYFTSKTSSQVTCPSAVAGRGQDGTTATSHAAGSTVRMQIVTAYWDALRDGTAFSTSLAIPSGVVTPEDLVAGTGTSWAWQTWSPSYVNITVGNGTVVAKYIQVGKEVRFKWNLTFGSTTSISTGPTVTLPVASAATESGGTFSLAITDASDTSIRAPGLAYATSTSIIKLQYFNVNAVAVDITATAPITFATGDVIEVRGFYEVA